jgi:hypothetical protein
MAPWVQFYMSRVELTKLGYSDQFSDLDLQTADMLMTVGRVLNKIKNEELEALHKKQGRQ